MKFNFFKAMMIMGTLAGALSKAMDDGILTGDEAIEIVQLLSPMFGLDLSKPIINK